MRKKLIATLSMTVLLALVVAVFAGETHQGIQSFSKADTRFDKGICRYIGTDVDLESGADLDVESGATFSIAGTALTASAAEINAAADASSRSVAVSVTNLQEITFSAATPVIALTGIGSVNDTTNTITIAQPYPTDIEFTFYVTAASSNLVRIAGSATAVAIGSEWIGDNTDTLKVLTIATNAMNGISSMDN